MTNAFGIDDPRISKGDVQTGLKLAAGATRSSMFGAGKKNTSEIARRMARGKAQGKGTPRPFSRTALSRMKEDPFE